MRRQHLSLLVISRDWPKYRYTYLMYNTCPTYVGYTTIGSSAARGETNQTLNYQCVFRSQTETYERPHRVLAGSRVVLTFGRPANSRPPRFILERRERAALELCQGRGLIDPRRSARGASEIAPRQHRAPPPLG
ncbi:hypothetical protein EVAR_7699_1 [Eumeta japonica]|uniref:Uncharacterized protein n=1 Tax=Eumeta variegata TaxID=151549 RepID=A0A4C1TKZ5_EUMVA|nr:hypothetical protein EVAR_7699_1 [Eumeta japonica]